MRLPIDINAEAEAIKNTTLSSPGDTSKRTSLATS